MIQISAQDGMHQYDKRGRAITTWDDKKCNWIVNEQFADEEINWWGEDNDYPQGYTLAEFIVSHPDWESLPDIKVTWRWDTKESYKKSFGRDTNCNDLVFPQFHTRKWGYMNYTISEAVDLGKRYCGFARLADWTEISFNGESVWCGNYDGDE